tara:strand:+ start:1359 stop:1496 length:138 start_codon:yes stop_codon:yes gene_type:complete
MIMRQKLHQKLNNALLSSRDQAGLQNRDSFLLENYFGLDEFCKAG